MHDNYYVGISGNFLENDFWTFCRWILNVMVIINHVATAPGPLAAALGS